MHPHTFAPVQWPKPVVLPQLPRAPWEKPEPEGISWIMDSHWMIHGTRPVCVHLRPVVVAHPVPKDHAIARTLDTALGKVADLFATHPDARPLCTACGGLCTVRATVSGNSGKDVHASIKHNPFACVACQTGSGAAAWTVLSGHQRLALEALWQEAIAGGKPLP